MASSPTLLPVPAPGEDGVLGNGTSSNTQAAADRALVQTLLFNFILATLAIFLFFFLRKRVKYVYHPISCRYPSVVPAPRATFFSWIFSALKYDDVRLLKTHGLDHTMYIKFLMMMLKCMAIMCIFGLCFLVPIDATGKNKHLPADNTNRTSGTAVLSMANIMRESSSDRWRFLGHAGSLVFNSVVACVFLYLVYREYYLLRIVSKSRSRPENYTIMLQGVGKETSLEDVFNFFCDIFPDQIIAVHRVGDLSKARLTALKSKHWAKLQEDAKLESEDSSSRPMTKPVPSWLSGIGGVFCCLDDVDAIDFYGRKEASSATCLQVELQSPLPTDVVFVTFKSILTARACGQILLAHNIDDIWRVRPAPLVSDVNWDNCRHSWWSVFLRRLVVFIVTIALIVFWSIPTAFAVSIANVSTLSNIKAFQWLEWISSYPILKGFVEGYFPVLVIFIFFQLGLLLLRLLTSYEGHISRTGEDKSALGKFFAFMLINVFLISLLAGSVIGIWNQVEQIAQNSGYLLNLLAAKIPPQVNFFINYIATVAVLRQLMNLLRPLDLLIYLCATKTSHPRSRHARHRLRSPPELDFADVMATDLLVFAITITYSSISALILIFGLLYFAFAVVSMKYNLIYVYRQRHQGLGKMWPVLFTCCMLSLLIYQATLLGMFIVNSFGIGVVIAGACFCATIVFWVVLHRKFFRISKYAPLDRVQPVVLFHAGDPDVQLIVNAEGAIDLETAYIDPVLKAPRRHSRSSGAPQSPDTDKDDSDLDDHPDAAAEDIIERSEEHPDGLIA